MQQKLLRLAAIAAGGTGVLGFILGYGGDERVYSRGVMPTLHRDAIIQYEKLALDLNT